MGNISVSNFSNKYLDDFSSLYSYYFDHLYKRENFSLINRDNTLILLDKFDFSGFSHFYNFDSDSFAKSYVVKQIGFNDDRSCYNDLLERYKNSCEKFGVGVPVVEFFDNDLTYDLEVNDSDSYLDSICVKDSLRGQSLGNLLLSHTENLVRDRGSKRLFLNCEDSDEKVFNFYFSKGYLPFLRVGPSYSNGSGTYSMCKLLK